jgi:flagellar biosynthesis protein FliP
MTRRPWQRRVVEAGLCWLTVAASIRPTFGATMRPSQNLGLPLIGHTDSNPWNIVIVLTLLTLLPAILLSMTPFVRLLVIFHFLRQALGTQTTPSNQTLIALSLVLTYFLMQPVGTADRNQYAISCCGTRARKI